MEVFKANPTEYVIFIFDRLVDYDDYNDDLLRIIMLNMRMIALCEKCPNTEFFWSVFSHIQTEYGEILHISPYSVRMQKNKDQKELRIWTLFTQCRCWWS